MYQEMAYLIFPTDVKAPGLVPRKSLAITWRHYLNKLMKGLNDDGFLRGICSVRILSVYYVFTVVTRKPS